MQIGGKVLIREVILDLSLSVRQSTHAKTTNLPDGG